MQGPRRAIWLVTLAGAGAVVFPACGSTDSAPAPTPSSSSVQPTSKATLPGPNSFSPAPIAPLNPTASPKNDPAQSP
ncbi:hypothetical protein ACQ856_21230 [Mycolicibacterium psychrotolerans]|uniref:hypothetical protein n=1 Tax=Mycolicibacterium psychrotolerans TaxID=216929 RepID=UPI003D6714D2